MDIRADLLEQILVHAREEAPNECCGVVAVQRAGTGGAATAVRVHPAVNTASSPLRFEIDGLEVMRLIDSIEADGLELGAIYHSHTRTPPYPSQTDVNFATGWPGVEWIIVGLADPSTPEIRSYLIDGLRVAEVGLAGVLT
jgi:[CysO sulfur-carrier protein]-S-L-cysteine hydrolase